VGLRLEPGLVETIVGDVVGQPGALPLLSHALVETWERRRGNTLTRVGYTESGGVAGAIAQTADTEFGALAQEQQSIARRIFLRLTELGEEGTQDTRRRVPPAELIPRPEDAPAVEAVLGRLADARLITVAEATVEVAHEALIREWPALRHWLEEDREGLRTHRHLTDRALEWERIGREPGELYRGARLATASEWAEQHADRLNPLEREFLEASQTLAWSEEQERQRRRRQIMVGLSTALAITLLLALMAVQQWRRAERGQQHALRQASAGLAAQAVAELEGAYPERGVLLALEALEHYPHTPEAQHALAQAVRARVPFRVLSSPGAGPTRAVWSPDGERLAAVAAEGAMVIWDVPTGEEVLRIPHQAPRASTLYSSYVAWSPSGDQIAVTFQTGGHLARKLIAVRDAATGVLQRVLSQDGVASVAWSPDGEWILGSTSVGTALVWDVSTGAERLLLSGHTNSVTGASWSPAGERIVTVSMDGTARVWNVETGAEILKLSGHDGALLGVSWSPDGQRIATAGDDGTARVWNASSGEALLSLIGHTGEVRDVAWSPDGKWIATAGADGRARVWDATTGMAVFTLPGLMRDLQSVFWSPDGAWLGTSGGAFIRLWTLPQLELQLVGHSGDVLDARWSPDGTRIVTAGDDGTARVWNTTTGEPLLVFSKHGQTLHCASWSPSGDRVVTTGADGTARIWDAIYGEELTVFSGHINDIWHADWSPDGKYVVTDGADQFTKAWEAESGEPTGFWLHRQLDRGRSRWSPDGQCVVTTAELGASHQAVWVWDAGSGKRLLSFENHEDWTCAADWSPDGGRVVSTGHDRTARVWGAETGEELLVLTGHRGVVHDTDWSPDGKSIVTGDDAGEVKVWHAGSGKEIDGFSAEAAILNVDWSADGRYIVASGLFNPPLVQRAWNTTEDLIAHARECCFSRELTPEEREQFGLSAR
jgi:WD40 repeat protein